MYHNFKASIYSIIVPTKTDGNLSVPICDTIGSIAAHVLMTHEADSVMSASQST